MIAQISEVMFTAGDSRDFDEKDKDGNKTGNKITRYYAAFGSKDSGVARFEIEPEVLNLLEWGKTYNLDIELNSWRSSFFVKVVGAVEL